MKMKMKIQQQIALGNNTFPAAVINTCMVNVGKNIDNGMFSIACENGEIRIYIKIDNNNNNNNNNNTNKQQQQEDEIDSHYSQQQQQQHLKNSSSLLSSSLQKRNFYLVEIVSLLKRNYPVDSHAWSNNGETLVALQCNMVYIYQQQQYQQQQQMKNHESLLHCNADTTLYDDNDDDNRNHNHNDDDIHNNKNTIGNMDEFKQIGKYALETECNCVNIYEFNNDNNDNNNNDSFFLIMAAGAAGIEIHRYPLLINYPPKIIHTMYGITCIEFSINGKYIALSSAEGSISIVSTKFFLRDDTTITNNDNDISHIWQYRIINDRVTSMKWSDCNNFLAVGCWSNTVHMFANNTNNNNNTTIMGNKIIQNFTLLNNYTSCFQENIMKKAGIIHLKNSNSAGCWGYYLPLTKKSSSTSSSSSSSLVGNMISNNNVENNDYDDFILPDWIITKTPFPGGNYICWSKDSQSISVSSSKMGIPCIYNIVSGRSMYNIETNKTMKRELFKNKPYMIYGICKLTLNESDPCIVVLDSDRIISIVNWYHENKNKNMKEIGKNEDYKNDYTDRKSIHHTDTEDKQYPLVLFQNEENNKKVMVLADNETDTIEIVKESNVNVNINVNNNNNNNNNNNSNPDKEFNLYIDYYLQSSMSLLVKNTNNNNNRNDDDNDDDDKRQQKSQTIYVPFLSLEHFEKQVIDSKMHHRSIFFAKGKDPLASLINTSSLSSSSPAMIKTSPIKIISCENYIGIIYPHIIYIYSREFDDWWVLERTSTIGVKQKREKMSLIVDASFINQNSIIMINSDKEIDLHILDGKNLSSEQKCIGLELSPQIDSTYDKNNNNHNNNNNNSNNNNNNSNIIISNNIDNEDIRLEATSHSNRFMILIKKKTSSILIYRGYVETKDSSEQSVHLDFKKNCENKNEQTIVNIFPLISLNNCALYLHCLSPDGNFLIFSLFHEKNHTEEKIWFICAPEYDMWIQRRTNKNISTRTFLALFEIEISNLSRRLYS